MFSVSYRCNGDITNYFSDLVKFFPPHKWKGTNCMVVGIENFIIFASKLDYEFCPGRQTSGR